MFILWDTTYMIVDVVGRVEDWRGNPQDSPKLRQLGLRHGYRKPTISHPAIQNHPSRPHRGTAFPARPPRSRAAGPTARAGGGGRKAPSRVAAGMY
jgi:hypothetical protein